MEFPEDGTLHNHRCENLSELQEFKPKGLETTLGLKKDEAGNSMYHTTRNFVIYINLV
jgi:hypothetical protein